MIEYKGPNKFKISVSVRGIGKRQMTLIGTRSEAQEKEQELKAELQNERKNRKTQLVNFGDLINYYHLLSSSQSEKWIARKTPLKEALMSIVHFQIEDYSQLPEHFAILRAENPRVYNYVFKRITHALRDAYKNERIQELPRIRPNFTTWPDESYELWQKYGPLFCDDPEIGDFIRFAKSTPYRPEQLASLSTENASIDGNLITYKSEKGTVIIPVTNDSLALLKRANVAKNGGKYFDLNYEEINRVWKSICLRHSLKLHMFEMHRFATNKIIEDGISIGAASLLGNWKTIQEFIRFGKTSKSQVNEVWAHISHKLLLHYRGLHPTHDEFRIGDYKLARFIAALIYLAQLKEYSGILDSCVSTSIGEVSLRELTQKGFLG